MKALILTPSTRSTEVRDIPTPTPGPGEVLIRVRAVALNPVDVTYVEDPVAEQHQRVVGTDFAGVVTGASNDLANIEDGRIQNGARVAGFLQGGLYLFAPQSIKTGSNTANQICSQLCQ